MAGPARGVQWQHCDDTEVASLPEGGTVDIVALLRIGPLQQVDNIVNIVALVAASNALAEVSSWACSRPLSSVSATSHQVIFNVARWQPPMRWQTYLPWPAAGHCFHDEYAAIMSDRCLQKCLTSAAEARTHNPSMMSSPTTKGL